jgi:hydrogenase nickel incorporation protein HypA/HybF
MHEFSISSEIVKAILDTAGRNGGRKVLSFRLEFGELMLLNVEQVTFWVGELLKGSMAEGAKINVKTIRARIKCGACGYHGVLTSEGNSLLQGLTPQCCPECGSLQSTIVKGRECLLKRIQLLK